MSILEIGGRKRFYAAALVPVVILACGGSSTTPADTAKGSDDAGSTDAASANPGTGGNNGEDASAGQGNPGTGGNNGEDSGPGTGSPPGTVADANACSATPSEVVMVGDSYFALSGEITTHLESLATAGGALAAGSSYRHYYASGANMYPYPNTTITPIPTQFANAVTANPDIKYVIMDGGGNDILLQNPECIEVSPDAGPISATCVTVIQNAVSTATTLFQTMQKAGVQKIIYFFYPHLPTTGKPSVNVIMDYSYPIIQQACATAAVNCTFIDTRSTFEGHTDYIGPDNIHPTTAGSDAIAGLIWAQMQQQCIAL